MTQKCTEIIFNTKIRRRRKIGRSNEHFYHLNTFGHRSHHSVCTCLDSKNASGARKERTAPTALQTLYNNDRQNILSLEWESALLQHVVCIPHKQPQKWKCFDVTSAYDCDYIYNNNSTSCTVFTPADNADCFRASRPTYSAICVHRYMCVRYLVYAWDVNFSNAAHLNPPHQRVKAQFVPNSLILI